MRHGQATKPVCFHLGPRAEVLGHGEPNLVPRCHENVRVLLLCASPVLGFGPEMFDLLLVMLTFAFPGLFPGVLSWMVTITQWLAPPAVPTSPSWRAPLLWDTSLLLLSLSRPGEMQLLSSHLPWGHQARGALKSWG